MTPYELNIYAEAYWARKKESYKEKISIAYANAKWTIQWLSKKSEQPEPLEVILDSMYQEKKIMTSEAMLKQVKFLNKMFGGEEIIVNS